MRETLKMIGGLVVWDEDVYSLAIDIAVKISPQSLTWWR